MSQFEGFHTVLNSSFLIPEGFDPTGTEIKTYIDKSRGFFKPRSADAKYTFILMQRPLGQTPYSKDRFLLVSGTPECIDKISLASDMGFRLIFVSPLIDVPDHWFVQDDLSQYLKSMFVAWGVTNEPKVEIPAIGSWSLRVDAAIRQRKTRSAPSSSTSVDSSSLGLNPDEIAELVRRIKARSSRSTASASSVPTDDGSSFGEMRLADLVEAIHDKVIRDQETARSSR